MKPEDSALVERTRCRATLAEKASNPDLARELRAIAGLAVTIDSELEVERKRSAMYRREASLAVSACVEALPLALGALERTIVLLRATELTPALLGHLMGLRSITKSVREAGARCDQLRPYLPAETI